MSPLCWGLCLWLWLMCTGVECVPKINLSSRDQDDAIADVATVTMNYIVDDNLITDDKKQVEAWLSYVTQKAMVDFQNVFQFTLNLSYTITYLADRSDLNSRLEQVGGSYPWPEEAISTLTDYFKGRPHSDIICLVTKKNIDDWSTVRHGYGYYAQDTLCENGLPILLAYATGQEGYSSHMLLSIIINSITPGLGEHVLNIPSDKLEAVKDYLRKCKNGREDGSTPISPSEPVSPPQPPAPPNEPAQPAPPEGPPTASPEDPEAPPQPPPGPPSPPGPAPPPEAPVTTTTTTKAPIPDYC
ncbi:wiskott-Aldrich syndrome protein family member 2-like [Ixodes scapularis]|uniref:wiskott-Aldrich syndrome protein family member 2-like n=1 Tax=Ixodes scapularis TaxID=6945 RepID=UPI001A9DE939|nr:wiskott-Aldrich syndrome protein family member 2-like [Ixodes scapularis]